MSRIAGFVGTERGNTSDTLLCMMKAINHHQLNYLRLLTLRDNQLENHIFHQNDTSSFIRQRLPQSPSLIQLGMGRYGNDNLIDLQPDSKEVTILADGYISNINQLKEELQQEQSDIRRSDIEHLLLAAYQKWNISLVHHIRGIYTITIYDHKVRKLWLIKDHFGMKPYFYYKDESNFIWSSEIKAILQHPEVRSDIFQSGLIANYYLQATPLPYTCFRNILAVRPGHYLEVDTQTLQTTEVKYWELPSSETSTTRDITAICDELEYRLSQSVKDCLQYAQDVISAISGGIDSTTITAIAFKSGFDLKGYSLGFDGSGGQNDELPQAKKFAASIGMQQIIQMFHADDFVTSLEERLSSFEAPYSALETGLIANRFLMEQGFHTALSGLGADEILGGYPYYLQHAKWKYRDLLHSIATVIPEWTDLSRKAKNKLSIPTPAHFYAGARWGMRPYEIKALFPKVGKAVFEEILSWLPANNARSEHAFLNELLHLELSHSLGAHHAYMNDLGAAPFGVENRYPYLDVSLVEWITSLPISLRYSHTQTKYLLRRVAEKYITPDNLNMPKKGFGLPMLPLWRHNVLFREFVIQKLSRLQKRSIFQHKVIDRWVGHIHKEFDMARIWQLVTTEIWLENYVDNK